MLVLRMQRAREFLVLGKEVVGNYSRPHGPPRKCVVIADALSSLASQSQYRSIDHGACWMVLLGQVKYSLHVFGRRAKKIIKRNTQLNTRIFTTLLLGHGFQIRYLLRK